MLGPRSRSASARAYQYEQVEHNLDGDERASKRSKEDERTHTSPPSSAPASASAAVAASTFRISVVTMAGAALAIRDASAADTILSVKEHVHALNSKLVVRRQRLVYSAGPHGMDALADDETLGGAGVAQDGSAQLDVLLADLSPIQAAELGRRFLDAARDGCANVMLELLNEGVDMEYKDASGCTALILAVSEGQAHCVQFLLEGGADKDAKLNYEDGGFSALIKAVMHGHADCARVLVDFGADIEIKDTFDETALLYAARRGDAISARVLLEGGADKNLQNESGFTALIWAAMCGRTDCVRLFVQSGADLEAKLQGSTALIHASAAGFTDCVRLLLEGGADKNAESNNGRTALDLARANGRSAIVELLTVRPGVTI
jgi:ankyrin repeat protein